MKKNLWWKISKWTFGILFSLVLIITICLYIFKDKICFYVIGELNKNLKAKVEIREVDLTFWSTFPNLSVDFKNVYIPDTISDINIKDTLLYTELFRLKFNPIDVWNDNYEVKELVIDPGVVKLKINEEGQENYDIFKASNDSTKSNFNVKIEEVLLTAVDFEYGNKATGQFYDSKIEKLNLTGDFSASAFNLKTNANVYFKSLSSGNVNLLQNKHVKFDFELLVNKDEKKIAFPQNTLWIENLPFLLQGNVDSLKMDFRIQAKNLNLKDLANNFGVKELNQIRTFDGKGFFNFDAKINGENKKDSPLNIDCIFNIKNGSIHEKEQNLKLSNIYVDGKYSNLGGKSKEFLALKDMKFNTLGGPFQGNLKITQFDNPLFVGSAHGKLDLSVLHALFTLPYIETIDGSLNVNSDFIVRSLSTNNAYDVQKCEGDLIFQNINAKLLNDSRDYEKLNGRLYLKNDEAGLENIALNISKSNFKLNGLFKNLKGYLKKEMPLNADLYLSSSFVSMQDMANNNKAINEAQPIQYNEKQYVIPQNVNAFVQLDVSKLAYGSHIFEQIQTGMTVSENSIKFPNFTLTNARTKIDGSLIIKEQSPEFFTVSMAARSSNISFKNIFKEWNNFDQELITDKNISGYANVDLVLEAPFDLREGIKKQGIRSTIKLEVFDGKLSDVQAFDEIIKSMKSSSAKLVLKKHDINNLEKQLKNLTFKKMENTILIANNTLHIPKMSILNNALDLDLSGTHTFENEIDYHFNFVFRDIVKKEKDAEFGEVIDDETGAKIYIRMFGNLDNPTVVWDSEARKQQAKENREIAKQDAKSILKQELGLFKKDSTVQEYKKPVKKEDEIILQFGKEEHDELKSNESSNDMKSRQNQLKNKIKNWKNNQQSEEKEEFKFE